MTAGVPGMLRGVTLTVAASAVLTAQLAASAGVPMWWPFVLAAVVRVAVCLAAGLFVRGRGLKWEASVAGAVAGAEVVWGLWPMTRGMPPAPLELLLMTALGSGAVVLAAAAGGIGAVRAAGVAGLAVCLLGALGAGAEVRPWLLTGASVAGVTWLAATYAARGSVTGARAAGRAVSLGAASAVAGMAGLACFATLATLPGSEMRARLAGVLASSGGEERGSDTAARGTGDGPQQISGSRDPRSIGFDEGGTFVNSEEPGLYDAFSEVFGEPAPKGGRMVMVKPTDRISTDREVAQDFRNGRSLELRRSRPAAARFGPATRPASERAVMWVTPPERGRSAHLPLAYFDRFTDGAWIPMGLPRHNAALSQREGWMSFVDAPADSPLLGAAEAWEVRLGRMTTEALPLPANTVSFKVGRVTRQDYFVGGGDHVVALFRRRVPTGTVVQIRARAVVATPDDAGPARTPPWQTSAGLAETARRWTDGIPEGWPQVLRVVETLRGRAVHDRTVVSTDSDGIDRVVSGDGRGSSLAIASASALMLRSLGYEARLAAGMYADPRRFDPDRWNIPLTVDDAHTWVEVRAAGGVWVTLEPTPGYSVGVPSSWGETAYEWAVWARRHAGWTVALGLLLAAATAWRRRLADLGATWMFRLRCRRLEPAALVPATLELIEARARRAGSPRTPGESPVGLLRRLGVEEDRVRLLERAAYLGTPADGRDSVRRAATDAERSARWAQVRRASRTN